MICKDCRAAGRFLPEYLENPDSALEKLIRSVHALCTGCDCQHKTKKVLRNSDRN